MVLAYLPNSIWGINPEWFIAKNAMDKYEYINGVTQGVQPLVEKRVKIEESPFTSLPEKAYWWAVAGFSFVRSC